MADDARPEQKDDPTTDGTERRDLRRALIFGVVAATIQMGILLALLYC